MTDLTFLAVFSVVPLGALVIAAALFWMTDSKPRNHHMHPGE